MIRLVSCMVLLVLLGSCNQLDSVFGKEESDKQVTYSYTCLDSAVSGSAWGKRLEKAGDVVRDIAVSEKSITDSLQTQYGRKFHDDAVKEGVFKILNEPALNQKLTRVMNELLSARQQPSGIQYMIYPVNDTTINAFTFGGRIYVTTGMLDKCKGKDALLYAIIGHEIGHSEAGHIKSTIQDLELSNKIFGEENGATFFQLKQLLTASFNQKNELEADYYGINLTNRLGHDLCTAVSFWRDMATKENSYNKVEDFFRTHPFSDLRSECLSNHIKTNFGKECGVVKASPLQEAAAE